VSAAAPRDDQKGLRPISKEFAMPMSHRMEAMKSAGTEDGIPGPGLFLWGVPHVADASPGDKEEV